MHPVTLLTIPPLLLATSAESTTSSNSNVSIITAMPGASSAEAANSGCSAVAATVRSCVPTSSDQPGISFAVCACYSSGTYDGSGYDRALSTCSEYLNSADQGSSFKSQIDNAQGYCSSIGLLVGDAGSITSSGASGSATGGGGVGGSGSVTQTANISPVSAFSSAPPPATVAAGLGQSIHPLGDLSLVFGGFFAFALFLGSAAFIL